MPENTRFYNYLVTFSLSVTISRVYVSHCQMLCEKGCCNIVQTVETLLLNNDENIAAVFYHLYRTSWQKQK